MSIEAHLRTLLRNLTERLRHWRRLRALDERIATLEDDVGDLEELADGARRRLEGKASDAAFRELLERDVASVRGIGPILAERIARHPLPRNPAAFRASVDEVEGIGPERKERLLRWERTSRERHQKLRDEMLEEGGVDAELEAELARLRSERAEAEADLRAVRDRREELARSG